MRLTSLLRSAVVGGYHGWLTRQPLAARTRDAYLAQVRDFVRWLAGSEHGARALSEPAVRDWAVRDYKRFVKATKRWGPASVNQALAAIDNSYRSLGTGRPEVAREELAQTAPRALDEAEQRTFLRFVAASPSARDRAIATVFLYTGLRLSELAALNMTDVAISARRGRVTIRTGKGDAYRKVRSTVRAGPLWRRGSRPGPSNWLRSRRRGRATGHRRRSPRRCGFRARGRG